jgi:hypothetical protein
MSSFLQIFDDKQRKTTRLFTAGSASRTYIARGADRQVIETPTAILLPAQLDIRGARI